MAIVAGRKYTVKKNNVKIAAIRTKTVSTSRTPIDITTDDDSGTVELLSGAGNQASVQVTITLSGLANDNVLRPIGLATTGTAYLTDITFECADVTPVDVVRGDFFVTAYEETGEYEGAATFTCTMVSSGPVTVGD